jgi:hypothetical protein
MMMALIGAEIAKADHRVVVYVKQDNYPVDALGRAEDTARRILADADVTLVFRSGSAAKAKPTETAIELQMEGRVADNFHPGAFAIAAPYSDSGTRIRVFCDRVIRYTPDAGTGIILGYVLAHEIGHVLEGVVRHSEGGVMKAHWENADYRRMKSSGLGWDTIDTELIGRASESRTIRAAATASRDARQTLSTPRPCPVDTRER